MKQISLRSGSLLGLLVLMLIPWLLHSLLT